MDWWKNISAIHEFIIFYRTIPHTFTFKNSKRSSSLVGASIVSSGLHVEAGIIISGPLNNKIINTHNNWHIYLGRKFLRFNGNDQQASRSSKVRNVDIGWNPLDLDFFCGMPGTGVRRTFPRRFRTCVFDAQKKLQPVALWGWQWMVNRGNVWRCLKNLRWLWSCWKRMPSEWMEHRTAWRLQSLTLLWFTHCSMWAFHWFPNSCRKTSNWIHLNISSAIIAGCLYADVGAYQGVSRMLACRVIAHQYLDGPSEREQIQVFGVEELDISVTVSIVMVSSDSKWKQEAMLSCKPPCKGTSSGAPWRFSADPVFNLVVIAHLKETRTCFIINLYIPTGNNALGIFWLDEMFGKHRKTPNFPKMRRNFLLFEVDISSIGW